MRSQRDSVVAGHEMNSLQNLPIARNVATTRIDLQCITQTRGDVEGPLASGRHGDTPIIDRRATPVSPTSTLTVRAPLCSSGAASQWSVG